MTGLASTVPFSKLFSTAHNQLLNHNHFPYFTVISRFQGVKIDPWGKPFSMNHDLVTSRRLVAHLFCYNSLA